MGEDHTALMEEGKRLYLAGEYPAASNVLRRAADAEPTSVAIWRALGYALKSAGNPPDAKAAFRKAIELDQGDPDSHFGLGLVESEMGDSQKAIEWFDSTLRSKPQHARAKSALVAELVKQGTARADAGDKSGAGESFARAFKTSPGTFEAASAYSEHLIEQKKYLEAYECAQAAKRHAPSDAKVAALFETLDTDPRVVRAKREHGLV
jgi:tetratricopeptide (TPR) repeat protein